MPMNSYATLKERRSSTECGCPEEEWEIGMFNVIIHLEPDGRGDIFIDCGDWEDDRRVECSGIDDLRKQAAEWVRSIPYNPNL